MCIDIIILVIFIKHIQVFFADILNNYQELLKSVWWRMISNATKINFSIKIKLPVKSTGK